MARGGKAVERSNAKTTVRLTPGTELRKLLKIKRSSDADKDEAIGTYANAVGHAIEKNHLHKKAWAAAVREDKMEPEQLRAFYEHLEHYREELGLNKRAESAPALPMDGEEETETEEEAETRGRNVRAFPAPNSVAVE